MTQLTMTKHDANIQKTRQIRKAAIVAIIVNGFLGLIKTLGGFIFHSHALIADGLHSLSDLVIDFMVVIGGHWSHQEADSEHPYGHQRIETALTLMISLFLILTGCVIGLDALRGLFHPVLHHTNSMAFALACISALANEGLFRYTLHLNKNINTDLLKACAWHHRSDALTAAVVIIGILFSLVGFPAFDHLAAVIVGIMIIKMGWDYAWESIQQLIDRGVDPHTNDAIKDRILKCAGVEKVHQLRTRLMGQDIYVDVHALVDPFISVSAGHYIAQDVHHQLMKTFPNIKDVTVHIDPEDDESYPVNIHLPSTDKIAEKLIKNWRKKHPELIDWTVHYLNNEIQMDLFIQPSHKNLDELKKFIQQECQDFHPSIKTIRILSEQASIVILASNSSS